MFLNRNVSFPYIAFKTSFVFRIFPLYYDTLRYVFLFIYSDYCSLSVSVRDSLILEKYQLFEYRFFAIHSIFSFWNFFWTYAELSPSVMSLNPSFTFFICLSLCAPFHVIVQIYHLIHKIVKSNEIDFRDYVFIYRRFILLLSKAGVSILPPPTVGGPMSYCLTSALQ